MLRATTVSALLITAAACPGQTGALAAVADPNPGIEIRVHYDTGFGRSISLRGSRPPLRWSLGIRARWTTGNVWRWRAPRGMGRFEFKPVLDDTTWSVGANYAAATDATGIDVYPFFGPAKGTVHVVTGVRSPQLGNTRNLRVYLPPSYTENRQKHYPVLYMHDGQNLFDPRTAYGGVEWRVDETFDQRIGRGEVRETIVVGIDNTQDRIREYTPTADPRYGGGRGDAYLDFLERTVKPLVDGRYRTRRGAADTRILGSSLGGLISCYAGWARPQVFGGAGCMSSSFWWNGEARIRRVRAYRGPKPQVTFYLDVGGLESGMAATLRMRDALVGQGFRIDRDLTVWVQPLGRHDEASWAARLHRPLQALLAWK